MIDERTERVLWASIQSFIINNEPVGSRYLTKKYDFDCSPATIRNIMADLEDIGLLMQPHTSAGRVPTDRGYRFYVEHLRDKSPQHESSITDLLNSRLTNMMEDTESVLDETTRTLSSLSHFIGLAVSPGPEESTLKRLELIPYQDGRIAVIIFTKEGIISHKLIRNKLNFSRSELNRIAHYINKEFVGFNIKEIKEHLASEIERDRVMYDTLLSRAINLCKDAMNLYGSNVFMTGLSEMINLPDFSDVEKIKQLSRTIDDKNSIVSLMDMIIDSEGVQVVIGNENPVKEMETLSVVASTYSEGKKPTGVIGIIGPKRMDYSSVISLVDTAARFLTERFEEGGY